MLINDEKFASYIHTFAFTRSGLVEMTRKKQNKKVWFKQKTHFCGYKLFVLTDLHCYGTLFVICLQIYQNNQ